VTETDVMTRSLLTVQELADELRVAPSTLYQWRTDRRGPASFRLGGRVVYRRAAVEAWIDSQEQATARGGAQ
jgi:excisionase family DNA binding protein